MKKLLMATICLSVFAISLSVIQISCSKIEAQNSTNNTTSFNKILYKETIYNGTNPSIIRYSIINYDGSGVQHLNIPFPPGFRVPSYGQASLSPDMQKIFFIGFETAHPTNGIYSCDTSGANFLRIAECDPNAQEGFVSGAY
jgi:hypothetical protein